VPSLHKNFITLNKNNNEIKNNINGKDKNSAKIETKINKNSINFMKNIIKSNLRCTYNIDSELQ
jgi:hypothetical protein